MANKQNVSTIKEKNFIISISEDMYGNQNYIALGDNGDNQTVVCESDFAIFMDKLCKCMGQTDFVTQTFNSSEMFEKMLEKYETVDERGERLVERQRSYMSGDMDLSCLDLSALEKEFDEIDELLKQ